MTAPAPAPALEYLKPPEHAPRIHSAPDVTPEQVFAACATAPYPVYLWSDGLHDKGRYSIVTHSPYAVIRPHGPRALIRRGEHELVVPCDGVTLATAVAAEPAGADDLPFAGGAIGYITYEYALRYVGGAAPPGPLPAYHFALYDRAFVYDHRDGRGYWIGDPGGTAAVTEARPPRVPGPWQASVDRSTYLSHVERILEHIGAGDIYQANYTVRFAGPGRVDPAGLADRLRRAIATPMGAYLGYPFGSIWSCSPERIVAGRCGRHVESRPIKGTRRRDADPVRDRELMQELAADPKEKAELLMIVDLVRNDLGRVAPYGSVRVNHLFRTQTYANVHHLEAVVSADMPAEIDWYDVLAAVLPGGSVTGAPKRRATEILGDLEPAPRSVYTGALGYVSRNGGVDFNLPIRTAYHDGSSFYFHSGGGIVSDSDPEREYEEMLVKVDNIRTLLAAP